MILDYVAVDNITLFWEEIKFTADDFGYVFSTPNHNFNPNLN